MEVKGKRREGIPKRRWVTSRRTDSRKNGLLGDEV